MTRWLRIRTVLTATLVVTLTGCGGASVTPVGGRWVCDVTESTARLNARVAADEAIRPGLEAEVAASEKEARELEAKDRLAAIKAQLGSVSNPARMKLGLLMRSQDVGPKVEQYRALEFTYHDDGRYAVRDGDKAGAGKWMNLQPSKDEALLMLDSDSAGPVTFAWEGPDCLILVPGEIVFKRHR